MKKITESEMDIALEEAIAKSIAFWIETAAQNQRNADHYRSLLVKCGELIQELAHIADDGVKHQDILRVKIPELVEQLTKKP